MAHADLCTLKVITTNLSFLFTLSHLKILVNSEHYNVYWQSRFHILVVNLSCKSQKFQVPHFSSKTNTCLHWFDCALWHHKLMLEKYCAWAHHTDFNLGITSGHFKQLPVTTYWNALCYLFCLGILKCLTNISGVHMCNTWGNCNLLN